MVWANKYLAEKAPEMLERAKQYKSEQASIYADKIMRPMAKALCPAVLTEFDEEWNAGDDPYEPDWYTFADYLGEHIIAHHQSGDSEGIKDLYTFLNWALFEKTSYLHNEAFLSPCPQIAETIWNAWMKYIPLPVLDDILRYTGETPVTAAERKRLIENPELHASHWRPLHEKFIKVAIANNVPYSSPLEDEN